MFEMSKKKHRKEHLMRVIKDKVAEYKLMANRMG